MDTRRTGRCGAPDTEQEEAEDDSEATMQGKPQHPDFPEGRVEPYRAYTTEHDEIVDAEPEDVAAEIAGLEGDAEIPIEELRKRMAAFEEEERKAKAAKTA